MVVQNQTYDACMPDASGPGSGPPKGVLLFHPAPAVKVYLMNNELIDLAFIGFSPTAWHRLAAGAD